MEFWQLQILEVGGKDRATVVYDCSYCSIVHRFVAEELIDGRFRCVCGITIKPVAETLDTLRAIDEGLLATLEEKLQKRL